MQLTPFYTDFGFVERYRVSFERGGRPTVFCFLMDIFREKDPPTMQVF